MLSDPKTAGLKSDAYPDMPCCTRCCNKLHSVPLLEAYVPPIPFHFLQATHSPLLLTFR